MADKLPSRPPEGQVKADVRPKVPSAASHDAAYSTEAPAPQPPSPYTAGEARVVGPELVVGVPAADKAKPPQNDPPLVSAEKAQSAAGVTATQWAERKGHVPGKGPFKFRADPHRGKPHVAVVLAHKQWPPNKVVTEGEYDAAVEEAYSIPIGENLAEAATKKAAVEAEGASK